MNKQTVAAIMAVLAGSVSVANAATATVTPQQQPHISGAAAGKMILTALEKAAVTPPPAIAKAMASVTHQYCQMVATNKEGYQTQKRLSVMGIKTAIRTGIDWPLVLNFKETCASTKADLRIYKEANRPLVVAVRNRYHVPVWNTRAAFDFCAKREGVRGWNSVTSFGQYEQVMDGCFPHKK